MPIAPDKTGTAGCPRCGAPRVDGDILCPFCGIVFAKYRPDHVPDGSPDRARLLVTTVIHEPDARLSEWLLPRHPERDGLDLAMRASLLLILLIWSLWLISAAPDSNGAGQSVLHLVNLPFHEAGHLIFRPFGQFIASLGGTLGQLLMPLICAATLLLKTRDPYGAAVALWWFGQNFLDIAPYINDARAGVLPLLGGNFGHSSPYGFHDWEYLLTELGIPHLDHALAWTSHVTGACVMLLSILWGVVLLLRQRR